MANTFYKSQIEIINDIIQLSKYIKGKVPRVTKDSEFVVTKEENLREIDVHVCAIALIERPEVPDYRERLNYECKATAKSGR